MSRKFVGALVFALALPCTVSAQILGGRITAAAGTEGLRDGSYKIPAYIGQLGIEWRQPDSRWALRLGLMHYQLNERRSRANYFGCTEQCANSDRFGLTGLTFDGSFDLTKSKLRPYVLSGVGIYRANSLRSANYQCSFGGPGVSTCTYGAETERRLTEFTFGMHAGFGLAANVRKVSLFTEFRLLMLPTDGRTYARGMAPLTFGVKF